MSVPHLVSPPPHQIDPGVHPIIIHRYSFAKWIHGAGAGLAESPAEPTSRGRFFIPSGRMRSSWAKAASGVPGAWGKEVTRRKGRPGAAVHPVFADHLGRSWTLPRGRVHHKCHFVVVVVRTPSSSSWSHVRVKGGGADCSRCTDPWHVPRVRREVCTF